MKTLIMKLVVFTLVFGIAAVAAGEPKIVGKTVEYSAQGVVMKGYLA